METTKSILPENRPAIQVDENGLAGVEPGEKRTPMTHSADLPHTEGNWGWSALRKMGKQARILSRQRVN